MILYLAPVHLLEAGGAGPPAHVQMLFLDMALAHALGGKLLHAEPTREPSFSWTYVEFNDPYGI
jgi:hypothetical protein